jgi:hypothetical protein
MALRSENPFIGIDADTLQSLKAAYTTAILEIATTGKEYVLNGRTFSAADLKDMKDTLLAINQAIALLPGGNAAPRTAYPYFHRCY